GRGPESAGPARERARNAPQPRRSRRTTAGARTVRTRAVVRTDLMLLISTGPSLLMFVPPGRPAGLFRPGFILPIAEHLHWARPGPRECRWERPRAPASGADGFQEGEQGGGDDRKSTRLNSSHVSTSYAVFCLKKNSESRMFNVA